MPCYGYAAYIFQESRHNTCPILFLTILSIVNAFIDEEIISDLSRLQVWEIDKCTSIHSMVVYTEISKYRDYTFTDCDRVLNVISRTEQILEHIGTIPGGFIH